MVEISKEAIEDAIAAAGMEGWDHIEDRMRAALTTAAQHMSAPAREQVLEEENRIDVLRLQAFKTNSDADIQSYFDAVSKWFQSRHDRALKSQPAPQTGDGE